MEKLHCASFQIQSNNQDLVISKLSTKIFKEGISAAAWVDENWFIVQNSAYGQLKYMDISRQEEVPPRLIYETSTKWKINNFDVNFPFIGISQDDGDLIILDLRDLENDTEALLQPRFLINKPGEACMWVNLLKDTLRIYGCYEKSGIYGYSFEDEQLSWNKTEWHSIYDSLKYGLPKSLHIVQQEKLNKNNEEYCQDILVVSTYNGTIVYVYTEDSDENENELQEGCT